MDGGVIANMPGELWGKPGTVEIGVPSIYIEHPKAKILLDTGMDTKKWYDEELDWKLKHIQSDEQRLDYHLTKLGVKPEDINFIIPSHLHQEHIGFLYMFPNATCIVQIEELRHAYVPEKFEAFYGKREIFDLPNIRYQCIQGDYHLFPEIEILSTPGHTAGHQCIAVKTEHSGTLLFTGDALYTREMYEKDLLPHIPYEVNATQMTRSVDKIKSYANATNATLIFYHDREDFIKNVKTYPEYYD
jgi:N-acyl homoserine lactone hydrolase